MSITSTAERDEILDQIDPRARDLHRQAIIVDGHCDTPYRLRRHQLGIEDPDRTAQVDLATLQASGITGSFFAAYVPPFYEGHGAAAFADALIDIIHGEAQRHPAELTFADSTSGIREAKRRDRVALLIGIEGGHAIEDSLEKLANFYARGVRYMTLTHVNTNNWCDSSADDPRHGGLTAFGRDVVRNMNDLGMIVDISHISDAAFYHVLETTRVPVIASHSSCRAIAPHPRNLTDPMLRDLASVGGVCMINFFSGFIRRETAEALMAATPRTVKRKHLGPNEEVPEDRTDWADYCDWYRAIGAPVATLDQLVDHIVHAAEVAGAEAVGIGSDFDGVPALPEGLPDASKLPRITEAMLKRGFHENEVLGILGGNFLRAFEAIEAGRR